MWKYINNVQNIPIMHKIICENKGIMQSNEEKKKHEIKMNHLKINERTVWKWRNRAKQKVCGNKMNCGKKYVL